MNSHLNTRLNTRTPVRIAVPVLALAAVVASAAPAAAHVTVTPSETAAGAYTVLEIGVPHGCEGSPTTEVAIQIPDGINAVTPTRNPLWDVEKVMTRLEEPVQDSHGNEVTERVEQVVYTARTALPDGVRDTFELSLQLPDAAGEVLAFPAIQTCEQGQTAWTEVAAEGEDGHDLAHPAPTVTITDAAGDVHAEPVAAETPRTTDDDGTATALAVAGLVAGLLGLGAGVAALVTARRRP